MTMIPPLTSPVGIPVEMTDIHPPLLLVPAADLTSRSHMAVWLSGVHQAMPFPREYGDGHHWILMPPAAAVNGWVEVLDVDNEDALPERSDYTENRRLRSTLSPQYVMLRVGNPDPDDLTEGSGRFIALHRHELVHVRVRATTVPGSDSVQIMLRAANSRSVSVTLALSDGTTLTGRPLWDSPLEGTVRILDRTGHLFAVHLTHVIYVSYARPASRIRSRWPWAGGFWHHASRTLRRQPFHRPPMPSTPGFARSRP